MALPLPKPIRNALEVRANEHVGLLAEFSDPGALHDAVVDLRKRGYTRLDTFSPFPIHGMDRAMGLPVSKLAFLVFGGALVGLFAGFLLQWWTSEVDYPINISNKPLFAVESSVPIMFELTILFSALTAIGGMLALNGLPKPYDPLFYSKRFDRVTDDAFFLHVGQADAEFERGKTVRDLFGLGALGVEFVNHSGATDLSQSGEPLDTDAPVLATPPHTGGQI
ncbi:MAG TPA: DUF3341 domain-containing protein [Rubricoccaceae bacterium]|jgi:hypothetical protein